MLGLRQWAHLVRNRVPPAPRRHAKAAGSVAVPANLAAKILLRRARVDAGLSQAELARRAGITQPSIAKIENPDHELKLATLERVLAVLGKRVELASAAA